MIVRIYLRGLLATTATAVVVMWLLFAATAAAQTRVKVDVKTDAPKATLPAPAAAPAPATREVIQYVPVRRDCAAGGCEVIMVRKVVLVPVEVVRQAPPPPVVLAAPPVVVVQPRPVTYVVRKRWEPFGGIFRRD